LLLSVKGLTAGYGGAQALHGVDLEVGEGEIVSVLGANGAGKTTTLRAISSVVRSWSGEIEFAGRRLDRQPPEARAALGLGHLPEGRGILATLTVEENLLLGATVRRDGAAAYRRDRERMLELFPALRDKLKQHASALSGGQQQMLGMARALLGRPRLLMVDELSFGLAPIVVDELFRLVREIRQDGTAFLLVEQSAGVLSVSDRSYVIAGGRTVLEGRSSELRQHGAGQLARVYLGAGSGREVESTNGRGGRV
jgi:branched-chain amino acid transport system ATP-binding protein